MSCTLHQAQVRTAQHVNGLTVQIVTGKGQPRLQSKRKRLNLEENMNILRSKSTETEVHFKTRVLKNNE